MLSCLIHNLCLKAASAASIPANNPNGNKTFLANSVSTFFMNGKSDVINGLRKF